MIQLWHHYLAGVPEPVARAAVMRHVEESRFFPTVADVLSAVKTLQAEQRRVERAADESREADEYLPLGREERRTMARRILALVGQRALPTPDESEAA